MDIDFGIHAIPDTTFDIHAQEVNKIYKSDTSYGI